MSTALRRLRRFLTDDAGMSTVEYAIVSYTCPLRSAL